MRIKSPSEIITFLTKYNNQIRYVSFDVFDTLLRRDVAPPDRTKVPVLKKLKKILSKNDIQISIEALLNKRKKIELMVGNNIVKKGFDWDCPISIVLNELLSQFNIQENITGLLDELIQTEIDAEKSIVRPENQMPETLFHIAKMNKKLIWISDMYLEKRHIDILLDACGYSSFFSKGYVSSEIQLRKKTGRLYQFVLSDLKIQPSEWLHVGDNRRDDYKMVKRMGGKACHYLPKAYQKFNKDISKLKKRFKSKTNNAGATICLNLEKQFKEKYEKKRHNNLAYGIGFCLLGPLFINFIHHVIERINSNKIDLVLFPAREGFILQNIFETLKPLLIERKNNVDSIYCYLTRATTFKASINKIGMRELKKGFAHTPDPTIRVMLNRFGVPTTSLESILKKYQISSIDQPINDPHNDKNFQELIKDRRFLQFVCQSSENHREVLKKYLLQIGFWSKEKIAIIDVGWQGTVQDALTTAFIDESSWPQLFGYYMGFIGADNYLETPKSVYEGILYDRRNPSHTNIAFRNFLQLFEISTRAAHGTVVDLIETKTSNEIRPVFKAENDSARLLELKDNFLITSIQSGILDCVEAYKNLVPFIYESASQISPFFVMNVNRLMRLPTFGEGKLFNQFVNIEDFGNDRILKADHLNVFSVANPNILWKEGFLSSQKIPFLTIIYNLYKIFRYG